MWQPIAWRGPPISKATPAQLHVTSRSRFAGSAFTSKPPAARRSPKPLTLLDRGVIIPCESRHVLAVADGAGGTGGGGEASSAAVLFLRQHTELLRDPSACVSVLLKMDQEIARKPNGGETTCAFAVVADDQIFGASVGDSGVWLIAESKVSNLTQNQVRKPLIGSGNVQPVSFVQLRRREERLLLATDGLLKYAPTERIATICRELAPEFATKRLIELVRYASGALPPEASLSLWGNKSILGLANGLGCGR